jgi:hypothetical protein
LLASMKESADVVTSTEMTDSPPLAPQTSMLAPLAMRCRRKIAFHPTLGYAIAPPQPAKVARRNARERNRVKQVSFRLIRRDALKMYRLFYLRWIKIRRKVFNLEMYIFSKQ